MKAYWDITSKCNLRCKHCGAVSSLEIEDALSLCEVENIISNVSGIVNSIDFLGGEPFARENFNEILQKCESCDIAYSIITNGQIEEERLKEIFANKTKLQAILVSLEGLKEENDYIRGVGVFDRAIKTILGLKRIRDNGSNKFAIGINMTLNNLNKYNIDGILNLAINELNVDYIQISPILNLGNATMHNELLLKDEDKIECYMQLAERIKREQLQQKIRLSFNNQLFPEFLDALYGLTFPILGEGCTAGDGTIYINSLGEVKACRDCSEYIIDLKKENLLKHFEKMGTFLSRKSCKNIIRNQCECIYKETCNTCVLVEDIEKPKICSIIDARYDVDLLSETKVFCINEPCCFYEDENREVTAVYYPVAGEKVEYEKEGYEILKQIKHSGKTAADIANSLNLEKQIVFRFLVQEQSVNHVSQEVGYEKTFL